MLKINNTRGLSIRKVGYFFIGAALSGLLITAWGCSSGSSNAGVASPAQIPGIDTRIRSIAIGACLIPAGALDCFAPPPAGDPSAFTGPLIGLVFAGDILATLPPANDGAFVGGATGTFVDAGVNNVFPVALQPATNVPTGGFPSPLFGAKPFAQKLLLFEEFGREPLDANTPASASPFPRPMNAQSGPAPAAVRPAGERDELGGEQLGRHPRRANRGHAGSVGIPAVRARRFQAAAQ